MSFLRNLFGRKTGAENGSAPAATLPPPDAVPTAPPTQENAPASPHAPLVDNPAAALPVPALRPEDCVAFPLKAITDAFPSDLKSAIRKHPSEHVMVNIPKTALLPQLASGAVRITFGQLCSLTPEIFFNAGVVPPETKIALPLEPVLQAFKPHRRPDQKAATVPVNVPSIFGKAASSAPERPDAVNGSDPWFSQRRPSYDGPEIQPKNGDQILEVVPGADGKPAEIKTSIVGLEVRQAEPAAAPIPPDAIAMPAALSMPKPEAPAGPSVSSIAAPAAQPAPQPIALSIEVPKAEAPAPVASPAPVAPTVVEEKPSASITDRFAGFFGPAKTAPAPAPAPGAESAETPAAPAIAPIPENSIAVPLTVVIGAFPNEIRNALRDSDPASQTLYIPQDRVEQQMRAGKLRFKWSELSNWCRPGRFQTTIADQDVDLPLAGIVPLFLKTRSTPFVKKTFEIDARIPDVFAKTPEAQVAAESNVEVAPVTPATEQEPELEIVDVAPIPDFPAPAEPKPAPVEPIAEAPALKIEEPAPAPAVAPASELRLENPAGEVEPAPLPEAQPAPSFHLEEPAPALSPEPITDISVPEPQPEPIATPAAEIAPVATPEPALEAPPAPAPGTAALRFPSFFSTPEHAPVAPEPTPEPAPVAAAEAIVTPEPVAPIAEPEPAPAIVAEATPVTEPAPTPAISAVPNPEPAPEPAARSTPAGTPNSTQILQRVRTLPGVTGVFLATADGLLIAADLPQANENIMAAFAPTVFAQLAKYSTMANLGLPESIDLHLSSSNVHVRKAGKVFLGVLVQHGSPLPLADLNEISLAL